MALVGHRHVYEHLMATNYEQKSLDTLSEAEKAVASKFWVSPESPNVIVPTESYVMKNVEILEYDNIFLKSLNLDWASLGEEVIISC